MQYIETYLYDQNLNLNLTGSVLTANRDRDMYAHPLKFYRGIDNHFKLRVRNNDQKRVVIHDKTFIFNILDPTTRTTWLTRVATVVDGARGVAELKLTAGDLQDLPSQFYHWSVKVIDGEGNERVGYIDDNWGAAGTLELIDGAYPDFVASSVAVFNNGNTSEPLAAAPNANNNTALHTAVFYFDQAYTGDVIVQATLDHVENTLGANWFDLTTASYVAETGPAWLTFNGVYSAVRFVRVPTTGTVTQVLYRY